jgi:hypothetical protein
MKNPFPGMNPFIEGYKWSPLHGSMIYKIQDTLVEQLPEGYFLESETTLYVDAGGANETTHIIPDVYIVEDPASDYETSGAVTLTPPTKRRSAPLAKVRSLRIVDANNRGLVTSIELLSPANKSGSGLKQYRSKREKLLLAYVNLVEIDLLRGGERVDFYSTSDSDYLVQVIDRFNDEALEWHIEMFDRLPTIPIPLLPKDEPLKLDLQAVFERTFKRTTLPRALTYDFNELTPPLEDPKKIERMKSFLADIGTP